MGDIDTERLSNRWMRQYIRGNICNALQAMVDEGHLPDNLDRGSFTVERPRDPSHGDAATNAALVYGQVTGESPRSIGEKLCEHLAQFVDESEYLDSVDVAGPGFVNFQVSDGFRLAMLSDIRCSGSEYGTVDLGDNRKVVVEFVSANPTGPLVVVQARAAVLGDVVCNLLDKTGWSVQREYYVNDSGGQVRALGLSMEVRLRQLKGEDLEFPEEGYPGDYVWDLAEKFELRHPADAERIWQLSDNQRQELLGRFAAEEILKQHQDLLERYGVKFDRWYKESEIRQKDGPQKVIKQLRDVGYAYEKEGAVWLKASDFTDDRDRVLVKSNGAFTYLLPDLAYHKDKLERGFERMIDVLGPDHHGHVPGLRAGLAALGLDSEALEVLISQWVRLLRDGEEISMSKRQGTFITMEELLDEVGRDAARFLFIMKSSSSPVDFDLELAKSQSEENPVYYAQYAHARICSIFSQAEQQGYEVPGPAQLSSGGLTVLEEDAEHQLIKKLGDFPDVISESAGNLEPHRLANYVLELAAKFHNFYTHCRVLSADKKLSQARLYLCAGCREILAASLNILGVEPVEQM